MRDVIVLATVALFFALCVAYVRWCDHIIGPDPDGLGDGDNDVVGRATATVPAAVAEVAARDGVGVAP
jgi:hypothetical protein